MWKSWFLKGNISLIVKEIRQAVSLGGEAEAGGKALWFFIVSFCLLFRFSLDPAEPDK